VVVERFGDYLSAVLHTRKMKDFIKRRFGPPEGGEYDDGKSRYSRVLEYLINYLRNFDEEERDDPV
jgi:hypothetical protein